MTPPIVVHAPSSAGGRRVTAHAEYLGLAHSPQDVVDLLREAGLDPSAIRLDDENLVEWRGGGADVWR